VVFRDKSTGVPGADYLKATVMKYGSSGWEVVGSSHFSAGNAIYTSIAIAPDGTPYVAYNDAGNSNKATVMKFDGSNWVNVGSPGFSAGYVSYTSIAIDGSGTPYVGYMDGSQKATVMKFNGSNWETIGSPNFSGGRVDYTSLAINGNGTPYLAYRDAVNSSKATVKKFDGSSWVNVGSPGFSADTADYTSLAIDGSGTPYVAYSDFANLKKATVMKFDGSNWVVVGTAGFSAGQADYTSLAINGNGTPFVAYKDYGNSNKATVMGFDGNDWINAGTPGFSAGAVAYTSIAIYQDKPFVAYEDGGNSNKVTVMKYTPNQYTPLPVELTTFTASFAGSNVELNWQTATEVNNYGFEVERTSPRPSPYQGEGGEAGRGWEKIGFVQGHGNSNSPKNYSFEDKSVESGKYSYRLKQIDNDGGFRYSQEVEVKVEAIPTEFALFQNYPNPFNPSTIIKYSVPKIINNQSLIINLKVYDVLGNEVATLVNEEKAPGNYEVMFDGGKLASGVYISSITIGSKIKTAKMSLIK